MFVAQMLEVARSRLAIVPSHDRIGRAACLMAAPQTDMLVVCSRDIAVGVLTKTDIIVEIARLDAHALDVAVASIMKPDFAFCHAEDLLLDVWQHLMKDRGFRRVPVLDQARRPIGIVYAQDALQALLTEAQIEDQQLQNYVAGVGYR
jgi:predicted transcriptional regulator